MAKITVYSSQGKKIKDLDFKVEASLNKALVSQVLRVEQANLLKKCGKTKTRAEVAGGGKKPWRQKGTGRARAGSIRSPLFRGGGVVFGPRGVKRTLSVPKKMKAKAYLEMLGWQIKRKNLLVIEDIFVKSGKTKDADHLLSQLVKSGRSLLIVDRSEVKDLAPWKNLPLLEIRLLEAMRLIDLCSQSKLIFSLRAIEKLKEKYANV